MKLALAVSSNTLAGVADTPVLLEAAKELRVDTRLVDWRADGWDWAEAVLLHARWDYTDDVEAFTGWLQQRATLTPIFNPAARAVTTTHKSYLVDSLPPESRRRPRICCDPESRLTRTRCEGCSAPPRWLRSRRWVPEGVAWCDWPVWTRFARAR